MVKASIEQIKAIHSILHRKGLLPHKTEFVESFSNGRVSSTKDLWMSEARELISSLVQHKENTNKDDKGPMIRKLFAMCHEMYWIKKVQKVGEYGKLIEVNDYSAVYGWVLKYGYLKKDLRKYTYQELPKLISQFELHIYNPFISDLSRK